MNATTQILRIYECSDETYNAIVEWLSVNVSPMSYQSVTPPPLLPYLTQGKDWSMQRTDWLDVDIRLIDVHIDLTEFRLRFT
jgi:hypothetical protein